MVSSVVLFGYLGQKEKHLSGNGRRALLKTTTLIKKRKAATTGHLLESRPSVGVT